MADSLLHYDTVLQGLVQDAAHPLEQASAYHATVGVDKIDVSQKGATVADSRQIQFEIPINNTNTLIDSCLYFEGYFDVTVTGTEANRHGVGLTDMDNFIPRSFPLNNIIQFMDIKLNNITLRHENSDLKPLQERLIPCEVKEKLMDGTPVNKETFASWSRIIAARNQQNLITGGGVATTVNGLNMIGDKRTNRSYWRVVSSNNVASTVRYHFIEPLFHPILSTVPDKRALSNLQAQFIINMRLVNDLRSALFYSRGALSNTLTFTWNAPNANNFRILYKLIDAVSTSVSIPSTRLLPFTKYSLQRSNTQSILLNGDNYNKTKTFLYSVNANTMPDSICIYVARQRQFLASSAADHTNANPIRSDSQNQLDMTSLRINSLSIKIDTQANLFSTHDPFQLYQMSVANGLQDVSYHEWRNGKCIIILRPGVDFKAEAGKRHSFIMNVTAQCELAADEQRDYEIGEQQAAFPADRANGFSLDGDYEMTVVMADPAYLLMRDTDFVDIYGFDPDLVSNALSNEPNHLMEDSHKYGGAFNFNRFFKKVWRGAKRYLPLVQHYSNMAQAFSGKVIDKAQRAQNLIKDIEDNPYKGPDSGSASEQTQLGSAMRLGGRARKLL